MKQILLFISVFVIVCVKSEAQNAIPNPGFENWTNFGNYEDPDNWGTINSLTAGTGVKTVNKATGANAHSGTYAIELKTKSVFFQTAPGIAATGTINQQTQAVDGGVLFTLRPDSITGWFKYTPSGTDTASVDIRLSKWNGSARDAVGSATWTQSTSVTTYTQFKEAIVYSLSIDPDTMVITILCSSSDAPQLNSTLYIDDLALTFPSTPLSATATSTDATCNGTCNGTASVSASGGTSPHTYLWSNAQTTAAITGLCASSYTVTVTDAASQTATATVTVSQPAAISATIASTMPPLCNGQTDGSVDLTASGGTGSLTYSWSNGFTTEDLTGVGAGTYTVTVTDGNGCTNTATATVSQPTAITVSLSSTDETSSGANDGTASVSASGGTPGYTYLWSNNATIASVSGLAPGTYTVTVTDGNGCTMTGFASVNAAGCSLSATATAQDETCGQSNGSAAVTAAGAPMTHTVTVANFSFTPNTVSATVGDTIHWVWSNGSHTTTSTTIPNGASSWDALMNSTSTSFKYVVTVAGTYNYVCSPHAPNMAGVINVSAPPFTYSWSNGQTTATATGLSAGNYSVTVSDTSGCNAIASVTVGGNATPSVNASSVSPSCNGGNNGSATANVSGGTSPFSYIWSDTQMQTAQTATGLNAGTYTVTVSDNAGCSATGTVTITEPAPVTVITSATNATCGSSNGTATASGGISYQWSANAGNQVTATATGLAAGTYSVTVTDNNGCTGTASVTVSSTGGPTATVTTTPDTASQSNGTATVTASGGASPYTYLWSNSQTTATATGLAAGNYTVTVMDANACSFSATASVGSAAGVKALSNTGSLFSIYPNPSADGKFQVMLSFPGMPCLITVYNVIGEQVYSNIVRTNQPVVVDLEDKADGFYYFNVSSEDKVMTQKVIVSKK